MRKVSELSFVVRRRRLTFGARRGLAAGAICGGGGGGGGGGGADGKVIMERWYLSPYVEKPFNSKVIKVSYLN